MRTWKPREDTRCARCHRTFPAHRKVYVLPTKKFEPVDAGACDQFTEPLVVPTLPAAFINEITKGLDWLTAKVLSLTLGRKH